MNFLDLFAGIGGFRFGMERAGHKCVGYCEIDKYARASYQAIHDTELYVEDFPVKLSQSQESNWDLRTLEELCSMKLLERPNKSNHAIYSLRTSETYYHTTKGKRSRECLKSYMTWGMTLNGKCLTARISEFPKTENVCSLSDILEENVPQEFFLSQEKIQNFIINQQ